MSPTVHTLPWFTDFTLVVAVFAAGLVLCHTLFIRFFPLGAIAWKRIDYVWLAMAFVGLVSAVGAGKELLTRNMLNMETERLESARDHVEAQAQHGPSRLVCRDVVHEERYQSKADFERLQRELKAQCSWFRTVLLYFQANGQQDFHYAKPYPSGGEQEAYRIFSQDLKGYNEEVREVQNLRMMAKMTELEISAKLLGPLVLALALALRMTKVTAEIIAEKQKNRSDTKV